MIVLLSNSNVICLYLRRINTIVVLLLGVRTMLTRMSGAGGKAA